jgi:predicted transcriptional regulator
MARRSKLEVSVDILKVIAKEGEIRRATLMVKANLAWTVLKDFLSTMEKSGTIKTERKSSGLFISLTQEGYKLLHRFTEFESEFIPNPQVGADSLLASAMVQAQV